MNNKLGHPTRKERKYVKVILQRKKPLNLLGDHGIKFMVAAMGLYWQLNQLNDLQLYDGSVILCGEQPCNSAN